MSSAFIREPDEQRPVELPDLPVSGHVNYVTPRGLARLEAQADSVSRELARPETASDESRVARLRQERRYLETRLANAVTVDPARAPAGEVAFGATVTVEEQDGTVHRWSIVGEDEADAEAGSISWVSPLARALVGARVGDLVTWKRPIGELELEVTAIEPMRPAG